MTIYDFLIDDWKEVFEPRSIVSFQVVNRHFSLPIC
jgi:hypothetical protein